MKLLFKNRLLKKFFAMSLTAVFLTAAIIPGQQGFAAEGNAYKTTSSEAGDFSFIIASAEMLQNNEDIFDNGIQNLPNAIMSLRLQYDIDTMPPIGKGDTLDVRLVPTDPEKDFIIMDYTTSRLDTLKDGSIKLAELDMKSRRGISFIFEEIRASFTAEINMPFSVNEKMRTEYFKAHPHEDSVSFAYRLQYNGSDTGKNVIFKIKKGALQPVVKKFTKTTGTYEREGEIGHGAFLYNIYLGTELRQSNEFIIYDTPDINLGFDGYMKIAIPENYGKFDNIILSNGSSYYKEPGEIDDDKTEIFLYDIYYLTEPPENTTMPRQAAYEEKSLLLPRKDMFTGTTTIKSMDTATVPKNILLEKLSGTKLTQKEMQLIENNGGLYKTVGKGFKVRIKNFKGNGHNPGGNISLVYKMNIKNNSPKLNDKGLPVYFNTASYYGQEIPQCLSTEQSCTPIKREKVQLNQLDAFTTSGEISTGSISADVDSFSKVNFMKAAADSSRFPDKSKPLAGAVFSVYRISDDGSRQIAVNKDNIKLEKLITNEAGVLCDNSPEHSVIDLRLERGNYVFCELSAPSGYKIDSKETFVSVGFLDNSVLIGNSRIKDLLPGNTENRIQKKTFLPHSPFTGDLTSPLLFIAAAGICLIIIALLIIKKNNK